MRGFRVPFPLANAHRTDITFTVNPAGRAAAHRSPIPVPNDKVRKIKLLDTPAIPAR